MTWASDFRSMPRFSIGLLADHVDQDGDVPRSGMTPVDDKIGVHV